MHEAAEAIVSAVQDMSSNSTAPASYHPIAESY